MVDFIVTDYLQTIITISAAIGAVVGAVKFFLKYIDTRVQDKIDDKVSETISILCKDIENSKHEISLLKQAVDFIEKFFIEPMRLKGNRNDELDVPK